MVTKKLGALIASFKKYFKLGLALVESFRPILLPLYFDIVIEANEPLLIKAWFCLQFKTWESRFHKL